MEISISSPTSVNKNETLTSRYHKHQFNRKIGILKRTGIYGLPLGLNWADISNSVSLVRSEVSKMGWVRGSLFLPFDVNSLEIIFPMLITEMIRF